MPHAVIIIPSQVEMVADPVKQRHLSVCVMSAYKKNARMKRDEQIDKRGELKPRISNGQRCQSKNRWEYFQHPREVIVRMDCRPRENSRESAQQQGKNRALFSQHPA